MTTRTHLSIGEVLSLLSDDFPDLTITKIRFLESQGLIDPERTASGYRKFYDFDIERLRWILRQQRENFLPLKVIRDRLDESDGRHASAAAEPPAQPQLDIARDPGEDDPPPVWMADHARVTTGRKPEPSETNPAEAPRDRVAPADDAPLEDAPPVRAPAAESKQKPKPKPKPKADERAAGRPRDPAGAKKKPEHAVTATNKDRSKKSTSTAAAGDVSDVSMTREELLGATGLDDARLTELESFGIVTVSDGPAGPLYGADALICARHAATMLELGMEPRHLRAFKVAADREAGLYEQLILPVLRRRTPDARREALEIVDRLVASGAAIHAALLRSSMGGPFGRRR